MFIVAVGTMLGTGRTLTQQGASITARPDSDLVGHWLLSGGCQDSSGHNHHGINHGVDMSGDVEDAHFHCRYGCELRDWSQKLTGHLQGDLNSCNTEAIDSTQSVATADSIQNPRCTHGRLRR